MELDPSITCDVLAVGSGIAGCMAAIRAAEAGARVCLASAGPLFSGSSFFEGTWGLGCIAPDGEADAEASSSQSRTLSNQTVDEQGDESTSASSSSRSSTGTSSSYSYFSND